MSKKVGMDIGMHQSNLKKYWIGTGMMLTFVLGFAGCGKSNEIIKSRPKDPSAKVMSETKIEEEKSEDREEKNYMAMYKEEGKLPNLSEVYKDLFSVGVAVARQDLRDEGKRKLILSQFNSLTCENEMKADSVLDRQATLLSGDEGHAVINMFKADDILSFAQQNGLKMRGHTLVWHNQTPKWFFTVGYSDAEDAPFVSREVMLVRMENYIKDEMEYVNRTYPGVIYAWDVVNEAIEPSQGHEKGLRIEKAYWYQVVGEDYIERAFEFARKYAAKEQELFYNDYNTYEKDKLLAIYNLIAGLKKKGLIDGVGMQSHIQMSYPTASDYEYAVKKYAELGIQVQVTELDIDAKTNTKEEQEKLGTRYKRMMISLNMLKQNNFADITNVTVWGLTDDRSWLNNETPSWPLLFDAKLEPKAAYFGILQDEAVPLY